MLWSAASDFIINSIDSFRSAGRRHSAGSANATEDTGNVADNLHQDSLEAENVSYRNDYPTACEPIESNPDVRSSPTTAKAPHTTIQRTPIYDSGTDSVVVVALSPGPGMKRDGWKPQNTLAGHSTTAIQRQESPQQLSKRESHAQKRKEIETFAPEEYQNPQNQSVSSSRNSSVKKMRTTKHFGLSSGILGPTDKAGGNAEIKSEKNHDTTNNSMTPSQAPRKLGNEMSKGPQKTDINRDQLNMPVRTPTAVRLAEHRLDFDEGFLSSLSRAPSPVKSSTASNDVTVSLMQALDGDIEDRSLSLREKKKLDNQQVQARKEKHKDKEEFAKPIAGLLPKKVPSVDHTKHSPKLSKTFVRDDNNHGQDEEGDTDELIKSSPRESFYGHGEKVVTTSKLGSIDRENVLGHQRTRSIDSSGDECAPCADIAPSPFQRSSSFFASQRSQASNQVDDDMNSRQTGEGHMLDVYVHGTIFKAPVVISLVREKRAFHFVDMDRVDTTLYVVQSKKISLSKNGTHAHVFLARTEACPVVNMYLAFQRKAGLQWFRGSLRNLGFSAVDEVDDIRLKKVIHKGLEEASRTRQDQKHISQLEETELLERRVLAGKACASRSSVGRQRLKQEPKPIPTEVRRQRRGIDLSTHAGEPGVDTIVHDEDPGDKASTNPRQTRQTVPKISERPIAEEATDRSSTAIGRNGRETRARQATAKASTVATPPASTKEQPIEKFSETGALGPPWKKPLIFPLVGQNKATVEFEDLSRLDDDEFLNDSIIQFGLRHAEEQNPHNKQDIYMFNTYFYTNLTRGKNKKEINYDAVKKWTSKIDLFGYNYIVVPINESLHWYVAIICNVRHAKKSPLHNTGSDPPEDAEDTRNVPSTPDYYPRTHAETVEEDQTESRPTTAALGDEILVFEPKPDIVSKLQPVSSEETEKTSSQPTVSVVVDDEREESEAATRTSKDNKALDTADAGVSKSRKGRPVKRHNANDFVIVTLDSFGVSRSPAIRNLKEYLREEATTKRGTSIEDPVGMTAKDIPTQENFSDCGLYMLAYLREFFRDPAQFVEQVLRKEMDDHQWNEPVNPSKWRNDLRTTIMQEHKKQHGPRPSPGKTSSQHIDHQIGNSDTKIGVPAINIIAREVTLVDTTHDASQVPVRPSQRKPVSSGNTVLAPSVPASDVPHEDCRRHPSRQSTPSRGSEISKEARGLTTIDSIAEDLDMIDGELEYINDQSQGKASTELSDATDNDDVDMFDDRSEHLHNGVDQSAEDEEMLDVGNLDQRSAEDTNASNHGELLEGLEFAAGQVIEFNAGGTTTMEQDTQEMNRRSSSRQPERG